MKAQKAQIDFFRMRLVDLFSGGGGASLGMEDATGQPVDVAINHDPAAILMHRTNHPYTTHFQEDIWTVDPVKVTDGQPVGLLWASPDCKHFSKAKMFAAYINEHCPDSREKSVALTKIEEAAMWANAAIARNE